ncbi:hypothetical protein GB937_005428 [Aspergillus fischeri]|nr:hypothetical protein GB937_005428 [Aspergillus fischeri]
MPMPSRWAAKSALLMIVVFLSPRTSIALPESSTSRLGSAAVRALLVYKAAKATEESFHSVRVKAIRLRTWEENV